MRARALPNRIALSALLAATATLLPAQLGLAPAQAAPVLSGLTYVPVGGVNDEITAADFNNDGRVDLAVTRAVSVSVVLRNGVGSFATAQNLNVIGDPTSATAADLNGDGYADLLVTTTSANAVSVFLNSGAGTFTTSTDFSVGASPRKIATEDFNQDGFMDAVVTNSGAGTISVLFGDGTGALTNRQDIAINSSPYGVATGDLNNDGKADLAVTSNVSNTVSILLGSGNGAFSLPAHSTTGTGPRGVAIADLDADGNKDVVVTNATANTVSVFRGNGTAAPIAKVDYATAAGPTGVTITDLNTDGRPDVAVSNTGGASVSVLTGTGVAAGLAAKTDFPVDPNPIGIVSLDVDDDGRPETVTTTTSFGDVDVLFGTPSAKLAPRIETSGFNQTTEMLLRDMDLDGVLDVVASTDATNGVWIFHGQGNGRFTLPPTTLNTVTNTDGLDVVDLNGDGILDIAAVNSSSNSVSLLMSGFDNSYDAEFHLTVGTSPIGVAVGDLNADGRLDIVTANSGTNNVSVLLGVGSGYSYATKVDYAVGGGVWGVRLGDANGDGRLDVVTNNLSADSVSVLLGTGTGTLLAKTDYNVGDEPYEVELADVNGDGRAEIFTANDIAGTISVLLATPSGFAPKVDYSAGDGAIGVEVVDVNGDGRKDIASTNIGADSMSVLLGKRSGTFGLKTEFPAGEGPYGLDVGDIDGDGLLDLVTANVSGYALNALLGNGAPAAYVSGDLAFGRASNGSSTTSRSVKLTNGGAAPLSVSGVQLVGANAADFEIRQESCTGPAIAVERSCAVKVRFAPETPGFKQAQLRITDNAVGPAQTVALTGYSAAPTPPGDTIAPETFFLSGPTGVTDDNTPTFGFDASEGSSFECRVDGGPWEGCVSPRTLLTQNDGFHTVEVRATDTAGNTDPTPAARSFTVDTTPPAGDVTDPDVFFTSGPTGTTKDNTPTFAFAANEAVTFTCRVDGAAYAPCTSPSTTAALSDGPHTFEVRGTDPAGNKSSVTRAVNVDTTPPNTIATAPKKVLTKKTKAKVTIAFSATESGATAMCKVDNGPMTSCKSPFVVTLALGKHLITIVTTDRIGNVDATPAKLTIKVKKLT